jgi:hypothetical protein
LSTSTPLEILLPTEIFATYWHFIRGRWEIYQRRLAGESPPWVDDPILNKFKFTNVFRATDRVSQRCIRLSYSGPSLDSFEEQFFRVLLFKFFNKEETFNLLTRELGEEPALSNFDFARYDKILETARAGKRKIYSNAYMLPCPADYGVPGIVRKHAMHLHMLGEMLRAELPRRIAEADSLEEAFWLLRRIRMLGDFCAYQFLIDLNYGPFLNFAESEFIVPGPGAKEGIRKSFKNPEKVPEARIIALVTEHQNELCYGYTGAFAPRLFGRSLQLIDIQNCFCETAKYSRVSHPQANLGRTAIKTAYAPEKARPFEKPFFPPKWKLKMEEP